MRTSYDRSKKSNGGSTPSEQNISRVNTPSELAHPIGAPVRKPVHDCVNPPAERPSRLPEEVRPNRVQPTVSTPPQGGGSITWHPSNVPYTESPKEETLEEVLSGVADLLNPSSEGSMREQLVQTALSTKKALEEKGVGKPAGKPAGKAARPKKEPHKHEKTNKGTKKLIWVLVIMGILAAALATVCILLTTGVISIGEKETEPTTVYTEPPTTVYEPQIGVIQEDLMSLYTDEFKTELAEGVSSDTLEEFFVRLSKAASNGEDTSKVVEELNTISSYLSDSERLAQYEGAEWDIVPEGFYNELVTMKESADLYAVEGLKSTVHLRADTLIEEREMYLEIKDFLTGTVDLLYFDATPYAEAIEKFTHIKVKEELSLLLAKVSADSRVAVAEEALKTAEDVEAATAELNSAKEAQQAAEKAWLMYTGEWVEEDTQPESESSSSSEVTGE